MSNNSKAVSTRPTKLRHQKARNGMEGSKNSKDLSDAAISPLSTISNRLHDKENSNIPTLDKQTIDINAMTDASVDYAALMGSENSVSKPFAFNEHSHFPSSYFMKDGSETVNLEILADSASKDHSSFLAKDTSIMGYFDSENTMMLKHDSTTREAANIAQSAVSDSYKPMSILQSFQSNGQKPTTGVFYENRDSSRSQNQFLDGAHLNSRHESNSSFVSNFSDAQVTSKGKSKTSSSSSSSAASSSKPKSVKSKKAENNKSDSPGTNDGGKNGRLYKTWSLEDREDCLVALTQVRRKYRKKLEDGEPPVAARVRRQDDLKAMTECLERTSSQIRDYYYRCVNRAQSLLNLKEPGAFDLKQPELANEAVYHFHRLVEMLGLHLGLHFRSELVKETDPTGSGFWRSQKGHVSAVTYEEAQDALSYAIALNVSEEERLGELMCASLREAQSRLAALSSSKGSAASRSSSRATQQQNIATVMSAISVGYKSAPNALESDVFDAAWRKVAKDWKDRCQEKGLEIGSRNSKKRSLDSIDSRVANDRKQKAQRIRQSSSNIDDYADQSRDQSSTIHDQIPKFQTPYTPSPGIIFQNQNRTDDSSSRHVRRSAIPNHEESSMISLGITSPLSISAADTSPITSLGSFLATSSVLTPSPNISKSLQQARENDASQGSLNGSQIQKKRVQPTQLRGDMPVSITKSITILPIDGANGLGDIKRMELSLRQDRKLSDIFDKIERDYPKSSSASDDKLGTELFLSHASSNNVRFFQSQHKDLMIAEVCASIGLASSTQHLELFYGWASPSQYNESARKKKELASPNLNQPLNNQIFPEASNTGIDTVSSRTRTSSKHNMNHPLATPSNNGKASLSSLTSSWLTGNSINTSRDAQGSAIKPNPQSSSPQTTTSSSIINHASTSSLPTAKASNKIGRKIQGGKIASR